MLCVNIGGGGRVAYEVKDILYYNYIIMMEKLEKRG